MSSEMSAKERSALGRIFFDDKSLCQQNMSEECNINTIVKRFGLTGQVPVSSRLPQFGDFTGVYDYQSALNSVMDADKSFSSLPADIRKKFDNDPQKFLEFVENPDNMNELRSLGLAKSLEPVSNPKDSMQDQAKPGDGVAN